MNSKQKGDIGLGAAIAYFTEDGYTVCVPLTDSQKFDLVVEKSGTLQRVQVKTTAAQRVPGKWDVCLKTCGGNKSRQKISKFNWKDVDLVFVRCGNGDRYLIPSAHITQEHTMRITGYHEIYKVHVHG